jgi:hypothetical protein
VTLNADQDKRDQHYPECGSRGGASCDCNVIAQGKDVAWFHRLEAVGQGEMVRRFPPGCLVKPRRSLMVPEKLGRVIGYCEEGVVVREEPDDGGPNAVCSPNWIRPVAYDRHRTPDFVAQVLAARPA